MKLATKKFLLVGLLTVGCRVMAAESTYLMDVVSSGPSLTTVQEVLAEKTERWKINRQDGAGNTALLLFITNASKVKNKETKLAILKSLIENGSDTSLVSSTGKTMLMRIAEAGDADIMQYFLDNYDSLELGTIDKQDNEGKTALFRAVQSNSATMVQQLLAKGASATIAETKGLKMTPLIAVVRQGWVEGVRLLLASGAANVALEAKDAHGMTALAVAAGHPALIQLLLNAGANPAELTDVTDSDGKTALFRAVQSNSAPAVQQLLAAGARATIAETKGDKMTPLIAAVRQGWVEGVKLLLASGAANVALEAKDAHGMTALIRAIELGNKEIEQLLLSAGASPAALDATDSNGKTALFRAVQSKSAPAVQQLLAAGASAAIAETKGNQMTPLIAAVREGWVKGVKLLLASGVANVALEAKYAHGMTALELATQQGNQEIMQLLLAEGAGASTREFNGKTILYIAVEQTSLPAVEKILSTPYTSTALSWTGTGPEKKTPLMRAVEIGWLEGVQAFLKNNQAIGNGLNAQDARGWTALHYATQNPIYPDIINALVDAGADITIKTRDGRDAWFYLSNSFWFSPKYDISGKKHSDGRKCVESKPCSLGTGKSGICCSRIEKQ